MEPRQAARFHFVINNGTHFVINNGNIDLIFKTDRGIICYKM